MTSATSTKELLNDYCLQARLYAAVDGSPMDRSAFPGLYVAPTAMIFGAGRILMYQTMDAPAQPLTAQVLAGALTNLGSSTVVADAETMNRLATYADNLPSGGSDALARRVMISRGLNKSLKLPVLTDALAARYWLPDGRDEASFDDWAEAFGAAGPSRAITMRSLISLARDGIRPESLGFDKTVSGLEGVERRAMETSLYSGASADCELFSLLERHGAKEAGLRVLDPGLLEMHKIDGQVCRVAPLGLTDSTFTAKVSSPFKLKEGRGGVRMTDGKNVFDGSLDSLRYGDGVLHAVFGFPQRGKNKELSRRMVREAHRGDSVLYAAEPVFEAVSSSLINKRWLGGDVETVSGRQVPLAVMLAGAPAVAQAA